MLALCAMEPPPTSGQSISVPLHFFLYGPDVQDQELPRVYHAGATFDFPSPFTYQGRSFDSCKVSTIIRPCLCIETISVCVH